MKKYLYVALLAFGVVMLMAPPVMAQEEKPFVIHGEFRLRGESLENTTDFDDSTDDRIGFWPYRVRIAAEGKFSKNITAWIEFQNASIAGGTGDPFRTGIGSDLGTDPLEGEGDSVELYQANITLAKLWSDKFTIRGGRQELVYGTELHLGDLDFYNGISHDGFAGSWDFKDWDLMLFYTLVNEGSTDPDQGQFPPLAVSLGPGGSEAFYGAYFTWGKKKHAFDAYALNEKDASAGVDRLTIGGRYAYAEGKQDKGLYWNVEYAMQTGDASPTIDAGGSILEGWLGYNFNRKHTLWGRVGMASGDDDPADTDDDVFAALFQDFHNRTGRGDWFVLGATPGGLEAWGIGYDGRIKDNLVWGVAYWDYSIAESLGAPDELGQAIDAYVTHNYSRNLSFTAAVSQLDPGDAFGPAADAATRLLGEARIRF